MVQPAETKGESVKTPLSKLSPRQMEILELVHADLTNDEIGKRLQCSACTVASSLRLIYARLEVRTRAGAAVKWERHHRRMRLI